MLKGAAALFAVLALALVIRSAHIVPLRITVNFNEGWNAYHTADLIAGRPLYPDPRGVFINNYPPLSFYVVAVLSRLGADPLIAGRVASLAAFVAWTALLVATARLFGCSLLEGAFAAGLFAVDMLIHTDYYVGVDDPQMLAQATAALGLLLVLQPSRTRQKLLVAALLLVAAVFVKQNVVTPVAAVVWLAVIDRRGAATLIAYAVAITAVGVLIVVALHGRPFVTETLLPRPFLADKLVSMSLAWARRWVVVIAGCGGLLVRARADARARFAAAYALMATAIGMVLLGGAGVYWNAMFEAQWALALSAAVVLNRVASVRVGYQRGLTAAYALAPAIALAQTVTIHWLSPRYWRDPRWFEASTAAREITFLREHPGAALCEDMTLCYFAGKAPEVDAFAVSQLLGKERAAEVARRRTRPS
jgi:hypothetical protein